MFTALVAFTWMNADRRGIEDAWFAVNGVVLLTLLVALIQDVALILSLLG